MVDLIILTDEYGFFTKSLNSTSSTNSIDINLVESYLKEVLGKNVNIKIMDYQQLKFGNGIEYQGTYVIYASSDDYGLFYKDYIEDMLLRLIAAGAILIPGFDFFRAHHNKVYMELYKTVFLNGCEDGIKTQVFSSYNMLKKYLECNLFPFPVVVKTASGAGSSGVGLANNKKELCRMAKKYSYRKYRDHYANLYRTPFMQMIKNLYRKLGNKRTVFYKPMQGKFIVQSFVSNLCNDFKVLVFGEKYYILKRLNRAGDFRASGSGKFLFPDNIEEIKSILDYARKVYLKMNVPYVSLDVADDGKQQYLIEYQCVNFGPYTLERSEWYFIHSEAGWVKKDTTSELEREYADALMYYWKRIDII